MAAVIFMRFEPVTQSSSPILAKPVGTKSVPELSVVRSARFALILLTLINLLNYLDRYLLAAIVPDLKVPPLSFSDHQVGWLGSAFLVVYMIAAPIFGRIGDRGSRPRPIALSVLLWSVATALTGLARSFPQMLAGRAALGIGEGGYVSIAPALLSDCFPAARRGRVLAILTMAIPVGSALGYVLGGLVRQYYGWRAVFFVAGLPGLLLALLALRLPDPPRGVQDGVAAGEPDPAAPASRGASVWDTIRVYRRLLQRASYVYIVLGYAAYSFAVGGLAYWMPAFLERVRGLSQTQATTGFGAIVVITGFLGTFLGGWLGDHLLRSSRQAYLWLSGWATLAAVPFAIASLAVSDPAIYYPSLIVAQLLLFMSTGPINAALVNDVSPFERASAVGLGTFLMHLLGDVPSPPLIGALSDAYSLASAVLVVPVAVVLSGVLWLVAARMHARESLAPSQV
jgi:MFS family permease